LNAIVKYCKGRHERERERERERAMKNEKESQLLAVTLNTSPKKAGPTTANQKTQRKYILTHHEPPRKQC